MRAQPYYDHASERYPGAAGRNQEPVPVNVDDVALLLLLALTVSLIAVASAAQLAMWAIR